MSNAFQNRLVGSIIFIALCIIFLPDFLDGKKVVYQDNFEQIPSQSETIKIPPQPEIPVTEIEQSLTEKKQSEQIIAAGQLDDESYENTFKDDSVEPSDTDKTGMQAVRKQTENEQKKQATNSSDEAAERDSEQNSVKQIPVKVQPEQSSADSQLVKTQAIGDQQAWTIQLGSFSKRSNADSLLKKLKQAGYVAYSRQVETSSGVLSKVYVGPELEKAKLEQQLPELQKLTRLKGRIYTYSTVE
ncbi:SPOR domain-containing protein [Gayadomonas joobiniege]|uniref:SPOR domain-containing protein n=1 Tax=Gayadomonas joobiniege TaxID=1234606 RepID=UPI00037D62B3|nr:SPOR domain-containing protein [Gayadomonas joobiniege]